MIFLTACMEWGYKSESPKMSIEATDSKLMTKGSFRVAELRTEEIVLNLIHDLSQPLSTIEVIASFLQLRLPPELTEAREYVSQLQHLVRDASDCLTGAAKASHLPIRTRDSFDYEDQPTVCEDLPNLPAALAAVP